MVLVLAVTVCRWGPKMKLDGVKVDPPTLPMENFTYGSDTPAAPVLSLLGRLCALFTKMVTLPPLDIFCAPPSGQAFTALS